MRSLLEGKPVSLLALLDDLCLHAGATDAGFVGAVHARFEGHAAFAPPRFDAATQFTARRPEGDRAYPAPRAQPRPLPHPYPTPTLPLPLTRCATLRGT